MLSLFKKKEYRIEVHGRAGLTYYENTRKVFIDSEMLRGDFDIVIYINDALMWSDGGKLTNQDKQRIKSNIAEKMKNSKIDWC